MHETTQLCIRQIRKYVTEDTRILDVGCGSGILWNASAEVRGRVIQWEQTLIHVRLMQPMRIWKSMASRRDQYEVMIGNIIDDQEGAG